MNAPVRRHPCKCGSMFCGVLCRFEPKEPNAAPQEVRTTTTPFADSPAVTPAVAAPRLTDGWRFRKPYQRSDQTDVTRWTEQDVVNIQRHCGTAT